MVRPKVLSWITLIVFVSMIYGVYGAGLGVNWGSIMSQPPNPPVIVEMLKANGIKKVKLFDSDSWTVQALAGSGIETMLAIPNDQLKRMNDFDNAKEYVKKNVSKHLYNGGVDIRYVAVGNEPFLQSYNGSFLKTTFPALKNIQQALDDAGLGDKIKAVVPQNADVYDSVGNKPSTGQFRRDIRSLMQDIVKFLHSKKAPFVVNIYPYLSLYLSATFPLDFAFFDGGGTPTNDNGHEYTNVFDANFDTLVVSLKKSGAADMKIIVGEVGWPTDGGKAASTELAHRFYKGFLKKMANKKGTPLKPGELEVYLFSLLDENMKSIAPGNFERHWGIFAYDGKPKFPLDLKGNGQDKFPIEAKVQYMPKQWCVFDKSVSNATLAGKNVDYACSRADCTPLGVGSSCNNLDKYGNFSYAFNIYFQMQDQDMQACDFDGMAKITNTNASRDGCLFPIAIVSSGEKLRLVSVTTLLLFFVVMALL